MIRTRVKICGITSLEDANHAVFQGADALGLVFYAASPRCISIDQASEIATRTPAFVSIVGLFVDASPNYIHKVMDAVSLDVLQFHGEEQEAECMQYGKPYLKALRVKNNIDIERAIEGYPSARAILLDTYHPDIPGGTGQAFDWTRIPPNLDRPIILAGGLNAGNVGQAISSVSPFAVDVSGGVELEKGKKDPQKVSAFFKAVYRADKKSG